MNTLNGTHAKAPKMYETENDISKERRSELTALMNQRLADADTANLFTEISRGIDQWLWFIEVHSQAAK
jgi:DNA-binding ferritin-like protein